MRSFFSRGEHTRRGSYGSLSTARTTHLRVPIHKRCLSPKSLDDDVGDDRVDGGDGLASRRLSYIKLPQLQFKLSVLKLDGSVFEVSVSRNATVGELKQAVEEVFTSSPKEDQSNISWFHVWGHFCLSFQGQKLTNDRTSIRNLGIKDGDQLQFVRHMSISYSNSRRRPRSENAAEKPYPLLPSGNDIQEERQQQITTQHKTEKENEDKSNSSYSNQLVEEEDKVSPTEDFKLAHFLKGWLSYSRLWGGSRKASPTQNSRPSRFKTPLLGSGPKMIELQG